MVANGARIRQFSHFRRLILGRERSFGHGSCALGEGADIAIAVARTAPKIPANEDDDAFHQDGYSLRLRHEDRDSSGRAPNNSETRTANPECSPMDAPKLFLAAGVLERHRRGGRPRADTQRCRGPLTLPAPHFPFIKERGSKNVTLTRKTMKDAEKAFKARLFCAPLFHRASHGGFREARSRYERQTDSRVNERV